MATPARDPFGRSHEGTKIHEVFHATLRVPSRLSVFQPVGGSLWDVVKKRWL